MSVQKGVSPEKVVYYRGIYSSTLTIASFLVADFFTDPSLLFALIRFVFAAPRSLSSCLLFFIFISTRGKCRWFSILRTSFVPLNLFTNLSAYCSCCRSRGATFPSFSLARAFQIRMFVSSEPDKMKRASAEKSAQNTRCARRGNGEVGRRSRRKVWRRWGEGEETVRRRCGDGVETVWRRCKVSGLGVIRFTFKG